MGCTTSRPSVDDASDDIINVCKERMVLIQKAISYRKDFSVAHLAYIESLEKLDSALKQFAEREHTCIEFSSIPSPGLVFEKLQPISTDSIEVTPHENNSPASSLSPWASNVSKVVDGDHFLPIDSSARSSMVSPELPNMKALLSPPVSNLYGSSLEEEEEVNAHMNLISPLRRAESLPELISYTKDEFDDDDDDDDDGDSDTYSPLPPSPFLANSSWFSDTFTPPVIPEHLREMRRMKKLDGNGNNMHVHDNVEKDQATQLDVNMNIIRAHETVKEGEGMQLSLNRNIVHVHENVKEDQQMHFDVHGDGEEDEGIPDLEEIEDNEEVRQDAMNDDREETMPKEVEKRVVSEDKVGISQETIYNKGSSNGKVNNDNVSNMQRELVIVEKFANENTKKPLNDMASLTGKNLTELMNHISDQFVKASKSGEDVSMILETQISQDLNDMKDYSKTFNAFRSYWSQKTYLMMQDIHEGNEFLECGMAGSHVSTLERLFAWEKKLYDEVKGGEFVRSYFDQKCKQLHILDARDAKDKNLAQREKMRVSLKKLDTRLIVALKTIRGTSKRIQDLTNAELFPQLCELLEGSVKMWKIMQECHQVQERISLEMHNLEYSVGNGINDDAHKNDIAELKHELDMWRKKFDAWFFTQKMYIEVLCAWLEKCYLTCDPRSKETRNVEIERDPVFHMLIEWRDSMESFKTRPDDGLRTFIGMLDLLEENRLHHVKSMKHLERTTKSQQRHDRAEVKSKYMGANAASIDENDHNLEASGSFTIKRTLNDGSVCVEGCESQSENEKSNLSRTVHGRQRTRLDVLKQLPVLFELFSQFAENASDMYEKAKTSPEMKDESNSEMDDEA